MSGAFKVIIFLLSVSSFVCAGDGFVLGSVHENAVGNELSYPGFDAMFGCISAVAGVVILVEEIGCEPDLISVINSDITNFFNPHLMLLNQTEIQTFPKMLGLGLGLSSMCMGLHMLYTAGKCWIKKWRQA